MQQRTYGFVGLISSSILFAMLLTILFVFTVSAHTVAPHEVQGVATPQLKNPHSYLKVDKQGFVIFSPSQAHMYAQVQSIQITNITGQTIGLYLNDVFQGNMLPGGVDSITFNYAGTDIFTIPNTNPNAQLAVIVKSYTTPNSDLEADSHGSIVFSPRKLTCSYYFGACVTITNTTSKQMSVYLNGVFSFTIYPNQVYKAGLGSPGMYIFTIPNTNPNTMLTVIGK